MILFIKHIEIEGPETLGSFFVEQGFPLQIVNLQDGDILPEDLRGIDAVIALGGPMNVYEEDRYPFLKEEDIFLKKVLAGQVPFLGICLGAQLLAKASGGRVVRSLKEEIGWFDIGFTPGGRKDPLFEGIPEPWEVFQWHGDMAEPLGGEVILASSARCPVQAFRVGTNAYGLQFHAEITDKSIRDWSADFSRDKQPEREAMLEHYDRVKDGFLRNGGRLCANFLKVMRAK